jgi:hypothetical protein
MRDHPDEPWSAPRCGTSLARMPETGVRIVWALCLAFGAMVTGIGIDLYASGAGRATGFAVAAAGVLFVPLASRAIDRLATAPASSRE